MQTVIFIAEEDLSKFQMTLEGAQADIQPPSRIVILSPEGYVAINSDPEIEADFMEEELAQIPIQQKFFFLIEASDMRLFRRLAEQIQHLCPVWVDDDHGCILPLKEYLARTRGSGSLRVPR